MRDKELNEKIELFAKNKLDKLMSILGFSLSDINTNYKVMEEKITNFKLDFDEVKGLLKSFISTAHSKFATKEQLQQQKEAYEKQQKEIEAIEQETIKLKNKYLIFSGAMIVIIPLVTFALEWLYTKTI